MSEINLSEEIKQEIKETVTKLANANLEFTIEDELEFTKVAVKSAEQKLEQVKQENKRLLEIINAKPLETVDIDSSFEIEKLKEQLQAKEQECERLKWYLKEIRDDELKNLDIEWGEYETHCIDTEYTNIINLVEEALEERSPEDCRYGK